MFLGKLFTSCNNVGLYLGTGTSGDNFTSNFWICSAAMVAWCSYNFIYILAESKNICILQFKESYIVKNGVALFAIVIDVS